MGKYHIRKNSLWNGPRSSKGMSVEGGTHVNRPPTFNTTGTGSDIVICHEEYIADILPTTNFTIQTYVNNPGNPQLMPWMSQIAALYEEFELLGMVYVYKSTCAQVAATSTNMGLGTVIIATDYDCLDTSFANKRAMEAAEFSTSGSPLESQCHPIECDPKRNTLTTHYVVPGATTVASIPGDARFSVPCVTSVGTVNMPTGSGTAIGELWCSYHVRCSRPILETVAGTFSQHITAVTSGGASGSVILSRNTVIGANGFSPSTFGNPTSGALALSCTNPGKYLILYTANLNSVSNSVTFTPTVPYLSGTATLANVAGGGGQLFDTYPVNVSATVSAANSSTSTYTNSFVSASIVNFSSVGDYWACYFPQTSTANLTVIHDYFITNLPLGLASRRGKTVQQQIQEALGPSATRINEGDLSNITALPCKHTDGPPPRDEHIQTPAAASTTTSQSSPQPSSQAQACPRRLTCQDEGSGDEEDTPDALEQTLTTAATVMSLEDQAALAKILVKYKP